MTPLIAITGGIGSGKSAICRCLAAWGMEVYDCDSRAKLLMDNNAEIHRQLCDKISPEIVKDGVINRQLLSKIVFSDATKLKTLNSIVHNHVKEDIRNWRLTHARQPILFVETAILLESGLQHEVDEVWLVDAPEDIRLSRACRRDNASKESILARMNNQQRIRQNDIPIPLHIIDNGGKSSIISQLRKLLSTRFIGIDISYRQWKN